MIKVHEYTPIFKENSNLDGCTIYAQSMAEAKEKFLEFYEENELIGVEILTYNIEMEIEEYRNID